MLHNHFFSLIDALSSIRRLSQLPVQGVSEQALLNEALQALVEHQDLAFSSILIRQGELLHWQAGFQLVAASDSQGEIKDTAFSVKKGLMGLTCQTKKIQYCRNCCDDQRIDADEKTAVYYGEGSHICVPLVSNDVVLGVLNVSHQMPEYFQAWHQHLLVLFADSLAQIIHLHRLVDNLDQVLGERTKDLHRALAESESLRRHYQELTIQDELTGLNNRRYFFSEGRILLANAQRYEQPLSMLLVDLDVFKRLNDQLGHAAGDLMLQRISPLLKKETRKGDLLSRLGGDEFILMLPNTDEQGSTEMAARIERQLAEIDLGLPDQNRLTASIGITTYNGRTQDNISDLFDQMYREADQAMYAVKGRGGNGWKLYVSDVKDKVIGYQS